MHYEYHFGNTFFYCGIFNAPLNLELILMNSLPLFSYFQLQQKWKEVAQDCTKAVELNPKYVKALFRRAKAHEKLDNKKECLEGEGVFVLL